MRRFLIIFVMANIAISCTHKEAVMQDAATLSQHEVIDSEEEKTSEAQSSAKNNDLQPRASGKPKRSSCATMARSCNKDCDSYRPATLYLAGGKARDLFEGYLSENKGIRERIPLTFKVKFYEKNGTRKDLKLETVGLEPWSLIGIDSRASVLNMFRKQMGERVAEVTDEKDLIREARQEKADLFLCRNKLRH